MRIAWILIGQGQNKTSVRRIMGWTIAESSKVADHTLESRLKLHNRSMRGSFSVEFQVWADLLSDYWDKQLSYPVKYGFPLDFDHNINLQANVKSPNLTGAFPQDFRAYLQDEIELEAIKGPFKEPLPPWINSTYPHILENVQNGHKTGV